MAKETKKKKGCGGCGRKKNKDKNAINIAKPRDPSEPKKVFKRVILKNSMSPGDILMLSAAVRDLKLKYGDYIELDVKTSCSSIWENNPHITKLDSNEKGVETIKAEYPLIHQSNTVPYHFIHGFAQHLEEKLGINFPVTEFKGDIHLSDDEKRWMSQIEELGIKDNFWIVYSGGKYDFTCIAEGSRILTDSGYKRIEEITAKDKVMTEWGFSSSDGAKYMGKKDCLKITTKTTELICTKDHKVKIINPEGEIEWKQAQDLNKNDYILGKRGEIWDYPNRLGKQEKYFALGRLWGDGFLRKKNQCTWIFSEKEPRSMWRVEEWLKSIKANYHITKRPPSGNRKLIDYRITTNVNCFEKDEIYSYEPRGEWRARGLPDKYFKLNKNELSALLLGFFSSDGTITEKGEISYTSIHYELIKDLRALLLSIGITTSISAKNFISIWGKECNYYKISILGTKSYNTFIDSVGGFYEDYRNNRLICKDFTNDKYHGIPNLESKIKKFAYSSNKDKYKNPYRIKGDLKKTNSIKDSNLDRILHLFEKDENTKILHDYRDNNWYFDKVDKIENHKDKIKVYDILNSETSSFVVNGLVVHNCKWWHPDRYQEVIDHFKGKITFVQVGEKKHWHTPLKNCINLVGKTDLRQLIRLTYHSVGVLGPVSFGMHAAAAVPVKNGRPKNRAAVIIAGAREPAQWEAYPHHRYLSNNGALMCADNGGCWKSRCAKIKDGDKKNVEKLCEKPVKITVMADYPKEKIDGDLTIPKCLHMIKTEHVTQAIESYYVGGALEYGSSIPDNIPDKAKEFITLG